MDHGVRGTDTMVAPDWIQEALDDDLADGEEIEAIEELDEDKLAIVATSQRGFLVKDRVLFSPKVWAFDLTVPAGANGTAEAEAETTATSFDETTTEPLPDAVETDEVDETDEAEPPTADEAPAKTEETTPPRLDARLAATDLDHLDGIGPARQDALAEIGIETFGDLAEADLQELADDIGVSATLVAGWKRQADLTQIHGIGPARSTGMREAGIHTLDALVEVDAESLSRILEAPKSTVEGWQDEARRMLTSAEDLTQIDGIGEARAERLVAHGVTTLEALIQADPAKVADALDVSEGTVEEWQKLAVEVPEVETDLLEVPGIGAARARELIRHGIRDADSLAEADAAELADALRVNEETVEGWQDAARGA